MSIARGFSPQVPPPRHTQSGCPMPPTPSPTYQRLRDTIAKHMRMSHVCQPLMLMELLGHRLARQQPAPPPCRT
jgi:hypothetical protein